MHKLNSLIIGQSMELMIVLPSLLHRSGFNVDAICNDTIFKKSKFIRNCEIISNFKNITEKLLTLNLDYYDLIVIGDDSTLQNILNSNLTIEQKLKFLPIQSDKNFGHIASKIGLSKTLSKAEVSTPPFIVANGFVETKIAAEKIGYPLMVKVDFSSGGNGVFECCNLTDLERIDAKIFDSPILIQKKIVGLELDLSAIYHNGKLLHFHYATIKKCIGNKFSPSVLRKYYQLGTTDETLFNEMEKLGEALGASGFVTISCIKSATDQKRYFLEADMRPNVWIEFTKFIGDDPAIKISNWFLKKEKMSYPFPINKTFPTQMIMPYFHRMSGKEILFNRYKVWKFLPKEDDELLKILLKRKIQNNHSIKKILPKKIKYLPTKLIKLAIPQREDRVRIRTKLKEPFKKGKIILIYFKTRNFRN